MILEALKILLLTSNRSKVNLASISSINSKIGGFEKILQAVVENQPASTITQVFNVEELKRALENSEFKDYLIIWDAVFDSSDELEKISQINNLFPNHAIVVVSDLDNEVILQQVIQAGGDDYLVKSELTPQLLRRSLVCAIQRHHRQNKQLISQLNHSCMPWQSLLEPTFEDILVDDNGIVVDSVIIANNYDILRQSEAKFRAIFEHSSIGIGLLDIKAQIFDINPAFCQMLGYSRDELCGHKISDYIYDEEAISEVKLYHQLRNENQETFEIECQFTHKSGHLVWAYFSVSLIYSIHGKSKFFLAMTEDITERKRTELKLLQSKEAAEAGSRAKSAFLATMSHELRTPLNAIMGLSQLLQQEILGNLNEKQQEYVNCIYSSGEHLLSLINDILDLSKIEAGKEELYFTTLSVNDICHNVISTVCDRAISKGLKIIVEIAENIETCIADERRLKQMLLNLLTNAIKFTQKGRISLEVKQKNQAIAFIITDTGIGIDSQYFSSLFEPFKQLDSQLNRQYEGTGLGLALTRKLAWLHSGDITVESSRDVGSRFTLLLPLQQPNISLTVDDNLDIKTINQSTNNPSSSLSISSKATIFKNILLVEDDNNTALLLQDYLQTIGYQVKWIATGEEFLTQVSSDIDLILLDVLLPGNINGLDLLKTLRQQKDFTELPVIMMTPMGMKDRDRFLQAGANDCLSKPIGIFQLELILMKYLS